MLLGVLIVARHPLGLAIPFEVFTPVFFHLFMVGWVAQLIFGIVFWMFPKFTKEQPRGSERLGWFTFASLNLGLLLRVVAEPGQAIQPAQVWSWMLVASAVLQWLAGLAFVLNTWARVKER
jgi:hypothetical protein